MEEEAVISKLKKDLKIRRYAQSTIFRYVYVVKSFLEFNQGKKYIDNLNEYDVIEYLNYLTNVRNYKSSSYNNINAILKFFLEVTLEKDIGYRRLPNAKVPVLNKKIISQEEIKTLINASIDIRQKCWFALAYGSGLRCGEIARLKVTDIDSKNMKIRVSGKGNKERLTVLPKSTLNWLREYCIVSKTTKYDEYLFVNSHDNFISEAVISKSLKRLVKNLGMDEKITMHSLRRGFATQSLRIGVPIEVVKELMGHNSISTTMNYIKAVYEDTKIKSPLDSEVYEIYSKADI